MALVVLGALALMTGCADNSARIDETPSPIATQEGWSSPTATATASAQHQVEYVATVKAEVIAPRDAPDGEPITELVNPTRPGVPLVFLVEQQQGDWLEVQLPIRPNGSTGWIEESEVTLSTLQYALEVSIDDRTVTLTKDGEPVESFPAAIGTGDTPTPTGDFYITELIIPTNPGYGPYAFGLSAFSEVLNSFGGGPGQIGLHGTPDADSIGQAASHGCIRLHNDDITYLAEILPLGTPISIR